MVAGDASLDARRLALQSETREVRVGQIDQQVDDFRLRTNNMLVEGYRLALVPLWLAYYVVERAPLPGRDQRPDRRPHRRAPRTRPVRLGEGDVSHPASLQKIVPSPPSLKGRGRGV